jgi:SnoaL-like polyketide cyclase
MSRQDENKAIVGRWFTKFWGQTCDLGIVDELAAPDMLLQYSLHEPRRGREDIKAFMTDFRKALPDLNFWGVADLIADGDYVVGRWEGGGTHTGAAFGDFLVGSLREHRSENAIYRYDCSKAERRQDHRRNRARRRRHRAAAAWADQACRLANDNRIAGLPDCHLEGRRRRYVYATVQCRSPSQQRPGCSRALLVHA